MYTYISVPIYKPLFNSLFGQIETAKLQNPRPKIIWLHRLYIVRNIGKRIVELNWEIERRRIKDG